jgi:hypothetical protein
MVVRAQVQSVNPYDGPVWSFSARVTLGDNVNGIAALRSPAGIGELVQCEVDQVDHRWKLVMLTEAN